MILRTSRLRWLIVLMATMPVVFLPNVFQGEEATPVTKAKPAGPATEAQLHAAFAQAEATLKVAPEKTKERAEAGRKAMQLADVCLPGAILAAG